MSGKPLAAPADTFELYDDMSIQWIGPVMMVTSAGACSVQERKWASMGRERMPVVRSWWADCRRGCSSQSDGCH